jgi:ribosomal protein S18 acetylase RimI-like enzyme
VVGDWTLEQATSSGIDQLMNWFPNKQAISIWGGPNFRHPFTQETFHEDVRWKEMASHFLRDPTGRIVAFGQFYERNGRINLARLVVHSDARAQGIGKKLIEGLMTAAKPLFDLSEFSLFVFRDNAPALKCYRSMGFVIRDYPDDMPLADSCYYLTRPANHQE